ncbi:ArsR/SmtB family transcription factor [Streptomyces erythrochromogenes]|uniref:ArsR/SmtB family transcription factor n=1 Tax=Streptomyces erythrochromogenes TaxID=285574 RepID=UPI003865B481|nr:winged helix-turn-helix domain-containing protein [Streptomyces erythrochromogenes]WST98277.1 winged helix-turn-helix domain-containing protein [Streptomyces erythrochromogenes]
MAEHRPPAQGDDQEDAQPRDEHGHLVLRSPQQFKALGHPVRHRMVNVLRQRPATLRQLARVLEMSKGTIGYHVRVLREAGLVRLAETRRVRGGTEQYFDLVSRSFTLHRDAAVGPEFLINAALGEMLPTPPGQASHTVLRHLWLTDAEAQALTTRLRTMVDEPHPTDPARGEPYGLLVSLFRADVPSLPPDDAPDPTAPDGAPASGGRDGRSA